MNPVRRDAAPLPMESAMLSTTLPRHPRTGLIALMMRKARPGEDPGQLYPVWPILGGDGRSDAQGGTGDGDGGDGDGSDGDGDQDNDGDGDDQDGSREGDDQDDDPDKDLGDKGRKALRELRRENRQLRSQLRSGAQGDSKKPGAKNGEQGDDDPEAIRERAREEARAEVWGERVEAAAIAAASGRLANPSRVAQLLGEDLADIPKDDKGRPDRAAISELIDDLLETDSYLAAPARGDGRRFQGGADGGARKTPKKAAATLGEAVANRLAGKSG